MISSLKIACVQVSPDGDRAANIRTAGAGVRRAAANGAKLVALPEYATQLHTSGRVMRGGAGSAYGAKVACAGWFSALALCTSHSDVETTHSITSSLYVKHPNDNND